ncbi:MAG: M28 family metallopeptidase [Candidatus Thorarchaeota archaeon]
MSVDELISNAIKKNEFEKELNEDNVYRITERLAFPRLIGSKGEKRAREIVVDEFKKVGFNRIYRDTFKTSFYNWIFIRYIFLITGSLLIFLAISIYISPYLTLFMVVLDIFISFSALKRVNSIKLSKNEIFNHETENIFVKLKSKKSNANVIFIGHWDSKSQSFPTSTRILIFLISVLGSLILLLIYFVLSLLAIIINFNSPILRNILLDICVIIAIIGAINYFNKTGNDSPGAYDNAAAVGTLVELARYYKLHPTTNIDLLFLSTGSEELNLGGAINFIQKYKKEFEKNSTFFINLDLIGGNELIRLITSYGIPRKVSSKKLNELFMKTSKELQIKLKEIYAPTGAWSDYMPIVHEGFDACWLGSQPGLKCVHTKKDTMDLVTLEGIKKILLLCTDVVKKLETEYNS